MNETQLPTDAERAEFEEMMRRETFEDLSRISDGDYKSYEARVGWIAWQAARRTPAPAAAQKPVAWRYKYKFRDIGETGAYEYHSHEFACVANMPVGEPLYTHPQPAAQDAEPDMFWDADEYLDAAFSAQGDSHE